MVFSSPFTALKALTLVTDDATVLTWPKLVTSTATNAHPPATWLLLDPKGQDQSVLLAGAGATRTFTPLIHSGNWWLLGMALSGALIYSHRVQVGDSLGWMDFPDWDDASWTLLDVFAHGIITARAGKNITLANVAFTVPTDMAILYQTLTLPLGLQMDTNVYFSTISGDDNTAIALLQATADATNTAFVATGHGMRQDTAGAQSALGVKDISVGSVGASLATVRRCLSSWGFEANNRSPSSTIQACDNAGKWITSTTYGHGGLGFHVARDFGLWVGRTTADGNPYTFEVTARIRVS